MKSRAAQSTTRGVMKVLALFSGTQSLGIICSIVRTKLVAVWLGPPGVALFSLYNTAVEMISSLAQMGIRTAGVKTIASASDEARQSVSLLVRHTGLALGLIFTLITIAIAGTLSQWTFGDTAHRPAFMLLAPVIFLNTYIASDQAILQGQRRLKSLAKASVAGVVTSLTIAVPLVYFMEMRSIIPVILTYSAVTALAYSIFGRNHNQKNHGVAMSSGDSLRQATALLRLGGCLTFSEFAAWASGYAFMSYLNRVGGENVVALYNAGYTMVVRYAGLIFAAIGMEFYPRLAALAGKSTLRTRLFVRHEIATVAAIVAPVAMIFAVAAPLLTKLLYTSEFLPIVTFMTIAASGTVLKAISWCLGYVIVARDNGMTYLLVEFASASLSLALNIVCYNHWGLDGLGWAFVSWYAVYAAIVWGVCRFRYGIHIAGRPATMLLLALMSTSLISLMAIYLPGPAAWTAAIVLSAAWTYGIMHSLGLSSTRQRRKSI